MSRASTLRVRHTETYRGEPLACFENMPGFDPAMTPAQMRALSAVLLLVAHDCEALLKDAHRYGPQRREYPTVDGATSCY